MDVDVVRGGAHHIIQVVTVHIHDTVTTGKPEDAGGGEGDHSVHGCHRLHQLQPEGEAGRGPIVVEGDAVNDAGLHIEHGGGCEV